jgi:hypothetical protein
VLALLQRGCATNHELLQSCILQRDVWRCGVAWRGTAGALGCVRCAVGGRRGVGSAGVFLSVCVQPEHRQLEHRFRDDHGPGIRPCALAHMRSAPENLRAAVVPAASGPGADVGMAHLGCGRVPAQMWACSGADEPSLVYDYLEVLAMVLYDEAPLVASLYTATRCMALRRGVVGTAGALGCVRCAVGGRREVGSAGFSTSVCVQPEHRQLEHSESDDHGRRTRPFAVARMRRASEVPSRRSVPGASGPRRRGGDGPPRMWASRSADVG